LNFNARWETEEGYDYVQVIVNDGVNDIPMCGNYTTSGVGFTGQPDGEPLYDGLQNEWINENIDLSDFLGQTITISFVMRSDGITEMDGFYMDDFKVFQVEEIDNAIETKQENEIFVFPNPANEKLYIKIENLRNVNFKVINLLGEDVVVDHSIRNNIIDMNVASLEKGMYTILILNDEGNIIQYSKFVKK